MNLNSPFLNRRSLLRSGLALSAMGKPIRNAFVKIWQVDNNGVYLNSADNRIRDRRGQKFQGCGRFLTELDGRVLLSHNQARPVSRSDTAYSFCGQ